MPRGPGLPTAGLAWSSLSLLPFTALPFQLGLCRISGWRDSLQEVGGIGWLLSQRPEPDHPHVGHGTSPVSLHRLEPKSPSSTAAFSEWEGSGAQPGGIGPHCFSQWVALLQAPVFLQVPPPVRNKAKETTLGQVVPYTSPIPSAPGTRQQRAKSSEFPPFPQVSRGPEALGIHFLSCPK